MSQEKMREEFEVWAEDALGLPKKRLRTGGYQSFGMHSAWEAWQASRAAVVIELPDSPGSHYNGAPVSALLDPLQCWRDGYEMAAKRIEAAGLKVKP